MNKIKDLRMYKNLTVDGLAYQLGVPAEKIVKWENGEERPTDREIILLSNLFHCTPEYLLGLEESMHGYADYIGEHKPFARPIVCPHCGGRSLEFVTEYHKAIGLRVFACILLFWVFIASLYNIPNILYYSLIEFAKSSASTKIEESIIAIVVPIVFYILLKLAIYGIESHTHVKSICRDCGHIWLID